MKINVEGAGAGKTTNMAKNIKEYNIPDGKNVYCIAFTNAAADVIESKLTKELGSIPKNIIVSTIHSFLYQELIMPYYYLIYGKHYERVSNSKLPYDNIEKQMFLNRLEEGNILHVSNMPLRAKWIVCGSSGDKKAERNKRKKILSNFRKYCAAIFVDEAQDIDDKIKDILTSLDSVAIDIILYGDPKQDVKGNGAFREMINEHPESVKYNNICHRSPQKHLDLSNLVAPTEEKQFADESNKSGSITIVFESEIQNVAEYINSGNFGLKYISKKDATFDTHDGEKDASFERLYDEVYCILNKRYNGTKSELQIKRDAFYISESMQYEYNKSGDGANVIRKFVNNHTFDDTLSHKEFALLCSAISDSSVTYKTAVIAVKSITIAKGQEDNNCLFVLTTDLAPYLFGEKIDDNKTKHLLYVALTRSLDNLTIFIERAVEDKYSKEVILNYFRLHGVVA